MDQSTAQSGAINSFPAGALLRREETDYLTSDQTYRWRNLLSLPTATRVKDASGAVVAQSEVHYDEAAYAPLPCGASVGWSDPGTNARGNATTTRRWLNIDNSWVEEHAQYDGCGSLRKRWDERGNMSQVDYSPAYHYAYPTQATSPVPDPTGQHGSATALVTTSAYDFATGLVTSTTDANNKSTTFQYDDALDRLTQINRPDGGRTIHAYVTASQCGAYVRTRMLLDAAGRETDSYVYFDGLGRPARAQTFDPQDSSAPWLTTDTQYDSMGRARRGSLQYRSAGCTSPVNPSGRWTETAYDALGRVQAVTTRPDNAAVTTQYSGNSVTVTDQAGRKRRSVSDALGRLVQVTEAPEVAGCQPDGAGCATLYAYDTLGNLRKVEQGSQLRFFMYDSLSRLVRAKNPEQDSNGALSLTDSVTGYSQWALGYTYDAAGNLLTRTDARGVATTYTYDALNRNTNVAYSDATPHVKRFYDTAANGLGRYRADWTVTAQGQHLTHNAVDSYDAAGRVLSRRQHFYTNNVAGPALSTGYAYDLLGNVTSQTYPSGRSVSYTYDAAGRPAAVAGNLGDGTQRAYATEIRYHELGGREQERFGTGTPVYNKHFYNVRGQLSDIRVSTHSITTPGQETNWNRGAIINHYSQAVWAGSDQYNNGNVMTQQVWIPNDDAISGFTLFQHFHTYDALNRLKKVNSGSEWQQSYDYDRWGNRTINATETWGGVPEPQFSVDAASNRLGVPAGQSGQMQYDAAGNLTLDTYQGGQGGGTRAYDAEGRMTSAQFMSGQTQTALYAYDADGRRVRRQLGAGGEVWQVHGAGGELLAEYAAGAAPSQTLKEYGYRAGELLVVAEAGQGSPTSQPVVWQNAVGVAVSGNSLTKTGAQGWNAGASSTQSISSGDGYVEFTAALASDDVLCGLSKGDANHSYEDIDFAIYASAYNNAVIVLEGGINKGSFGTWAAGERFRVAVEGGVVKYYRVATNGALTHFYTSSMTPQYPLLVDTSLHWVGDQITNVVLSAGTSAGSGGAEFKWLVTDHLGTPRMVIDQTGSLAGVRRHDYLPFGEDMPLGLEGRSAGHGYVADGVRQKFTGYERDSETGLDYAQARYYASAQGRFTSPDPLMRSAYVESPQTFNRYSYGLNNPLRFTDPTGLQADERGRGIPDPCKTHKCQKDEGGNLFYVEGEEIIIVLNTSNKDDNNPAVPVAGLQAPLGPSTLVQPPAAETAPSLGSRISGGLKSIGRTITNGIGGALFFILASPSTAQAPTLPPADTSTSPNPEDNKPTLQQDTLAPELAKKSRRTDKERATDIPSWAKRSKPKPGESGKDFARRVFREHDKPITDTGPKSDFNKLKKYGDRNK